MKLLLLMSLLPILTSSCVFSGDRQAPTAAIETRCLKAGLDIDKLNLDEIRGPNNILLRQVTHAQCSPIHDQK